MALSHEVQEMDEGGTLNEKPGIRSQERVGRETLEEHRKRMGAREL
jgi:hypothetical protein